MSTNRPGVSRTKKVAWGSVACFYLGACAISWPFFWWRDHHAASWATWAAPEFVKAWFPALGPALSSMVAYWFFRRKIPRHSSLFGTFKGRSLIFAAVPVILMTLVGLGDDEPHLTGLWWGGTLVVYAVGEELGWRGFLEDALQSLGEINRSVLIGIFWGAWHFTTFLSNDLTQTVERLALMYPIWILASWGLGRIVRVTRSIVAAAMVHLVFNFSVILPRAALATVLGVSIPLWIYLIMTWPKENSSSAADNRAV